MQLLLWNTMPSIPPRHLVWRNFHVINLIDKAWSDWPTFCPAVLPEEDTVRHCVNFHSYGQPKRDSQWLLLGAEAGAKGSLPLKGSPMALLHWNTSAASPAKGWKGSAGLEMSVSPQELTGVFLPESATKRQKWPKTILPEDCLMLDMTLKTTMKTNKNQQKCQLWVICSLEK